MKFSGRVYDGPWEGRSCADDRPYFWIALYPPLSRLSFSPDDNLVSPVDVYKGEYRWSYALRAWVFVWRAVR